MNKITKVALLATTSLMLAACSKGFLHASDGQTRAQSQGTGTESYGISDQSSFHGEDMLPDYPQSAPDADKVAQLPRIIYFGFDQYQIKGKNQKLLNQNANFLLTHPGIHVALAGNTDPRGSAEYNFHLGQRRANAVKDYLLAQGVPKGQMCTVSYGELRPAATPDDFGGNWKKAYAKDRRTELQYGQTCGDNKTAGGS